MVSCQWSVGAKHLEDKLSLIAKNSSPNASPVQLSVVSSQLSVVSCQFLLQNRYFEKVVHRFSVLSLSALIASKVT
ncbi:MAG: hypothetical protein HEQ24_18050 [Dolichospermum sp. BR01]|nr:hypothetical protein [Dolichospermum sp. BR01]